MRCWWRAILFLRPPDERSKLNDVNVIWRSFRRCLPALTLWLICATTSATVWGNYCPFCSAIALTFTEQLEANDVVVVAKLLEVPPPSDDPDADFPKAKFEIVQVLKGNKLVGPEMKFRTQLVGSYPDGQKFLVMGVDPPKIAWSTPMKASDLVFQYLNDIQKLPAKGPKRLEFFQDYFEHDESVLAFDAYDEFARAPYDDLIAMKDQMQHDKLVGWIEDPDTSVNRRRLYFTMLGVCGTEQDIEMLEEMIKSGDRKKQAGLDALIACYLTLKGEAGVDLVESTFLTDPDVDYVDTLAAVSALRFHGTEVEIVSKERIVSAVRHLLDKPKMADMIIPDLARWEDWTVMERLVEMFKNADDETNWLRVPVITYLRACPKPEAKTYIEELAKIDPDAVRRADFFIGGFEDDEDDEEEEDDEKSTEVTSSSEDTQESPDKIEAAESTENDGLDSENQDESEQPTFLDDASESHVVLKIPLQNEAVSALATAANSGTQEIGEKTEAILPVVPNPSPSTSVSNPAADSFPNPGTEQVAQTLPPSPPIAAIAPSTNLTWSIIFVPMGVCVVIFLLLWSVVNGWFERLIF
jgi:hypothetical protein